MKERIGMSTLCLYYWVDHKNWLDEQLKIVSVLKPYTLRLEIYFDINDILTNLDQKMLESYKEALQGFEFSLHLPSLSEKVGSLDKLIARLEYIVEFLSIDYCVLHVDEYVKLKLAKPKFKLGIRYGLENSDIRKFGFQHLKDIELLGKQSIVVDIDHIEEMQKGSLKKELQGLHNPIIGVHFSTPYNTYFKKYPDIKTTHYPFTHSGNPLPTDIPPNVPIICEGVIPPNDTSLIEEELTSIRRAYQNV